jgi:hypothetical protein
MSQHDEDRDKVVNALGGKKGLIDSGVPAIVFLIVFNFTKEVSTATWSALSLSVVLAIFRLIKKDTIQHSVSGVIGVLICAYFANRSGNAEDFLHSKVAHKSWVRNRLFDCKPCGLANFGAGLRSIAGRKLYVA